MAKQQLTDNDFIRAEQRGREADVEAALATSVRYDRSLGLIMIGLRGGALLLIPANLLQGIADAPPELVEEVELAAGGKALHWEKLDADFAVQGLVAGSFGTRKWMLQLAAAGHLDAASEARQQALQQFSPGGPTATVMGRRGGRVTSTAKTIAARANGKLGGRPRKIQCD